MKITPEAVYTWIVSLLAVKVVFLVAVNVSVLPVFQFFKLFCHLFEQYSQHLQCFFALSYLQFQAVVLLKPCRVCDKYWVYFKPCRSL